LGVGHFCLLFSYQLSCLPFVCMYHWCLWIMWPDSISLICSLYYPWGGQPICKKLSTVLVVVSCLSPFWLCMCYWLFAYAKSLCSLSEKRGNFLSSFVFYLFILFFIIVILCLFLCVCVSFKFGLYFTIWCPCYQLGLGTS